MEQDTPFAIQVAQLVSDPDFLRLQELYDQPNLFKAVGRTFTETWHSAFLGWLLDPKGSHGLGTFPLQRFIALVSDTDITPDETPAGICGPSELATSLITFDLYNAEIHPSEEHRSEKQLGSAGRIDLWIALEGEEEPEEESPEKLICLVEMKIDAKLGVDQATKYAEYAIEKSAQTGARYALIFLARREAMRDTSAETTDDPRWFCIDYQPLHDQVLVPALEHPNISQLMSPLLEHYISNMRWSGLKGGALAVTQEERDLARKVYDKYQNVFRTLDRLLSEEDDVDFPVGLTSADSPTKTDLRLTLKSGKVLQGKSVRAFMKAVLDHCAAKGLLSNLELPYATGKKRYFIASEPVHPSSREFISVLEYVFGYEMLYMEINMARPQALNSARKLLRGLGEAVAEP